MSTKDDTNQSPQVVDNESEETEEVDNTVEDSDVTEDSEDELSSLSESAQKTVMNFSNLSDEDKISKIKNLESSERSDQKEAAEAIRDIFDIPEAKAKTNVEISDDVINKAVEVKLAKMGVTAEAFSDFKQKDEKATRLEVARTWGKQQGLSDGQIKKLLTTPDFLKLYLNDDLKDLSVKARTRNALFEASSDKDFIAKLKIAEKKKTSKSAGLPPKGTTIKSEKPVNLMDTDASIAFLKN